MIRVIGAILASAVLNAVGQICFKLASNRMDPSVRRKGWGTYIGRILRKPMIWLGIAVMTPALAIWLVAMGQADLSQVYPIGSVYYIFVLVAAHFALGEKLTRQKILGTLLIFAGIAMVVRS